MPRRTSPCASTPAWGSSPLLLRARTTSPPTHSCHSTCRPGRWEGNGGRGGEQGGREARTLGRGQREVRAGGSPLPQRQLGGGEHLQRLAVLVVLEPRLLF